MRRNAEEELEISEFIKDPASLKLLILAGTNIRSNQIVTVNKCVSLIKLDLSSNQLKEIPLHFSNFHQMRILYLHDNQLSSCNIANTNLQYISLFDNLLLDYRANLIQANPKLMAIDYHVITKTERLFKTSPQSHSLLKWPIVEISQSLEHEEDYLNLLKAELFVINEVYKRATFTTVLNGYLLALSQNIQYDHLKHAIVNQNFFKVEKTKKIAVKWGEYVERRQKLKRILAGTAAEDLLLNKFQRTRLNRSPAVAEVLNKFMRYVRQRMKARKVLQRNFRSYRQNIPVTRQIEQRLLGQPLKLYFRQSEIYSLEKIFLFAKKLFFNRKQYDLCDNFEKIVCRTKKTYYIFRSRPKDDHTFLMHMLKNSMGLVLGEKGVDRRSVHYNKRGHKQIQIKQVKSRSAKLSWEKIKIVDGRIERLYKRYDNLLEYQFKNQAVYLAILRLLKYFNSGNGGVILQNQAAYFQTEVIFQDPNQKKKNEKLTIGYYQSITRVLSANAIQKWWRRMRSKIKSQKNIIKEIRITRAHNLIGRWLRDMTFRHRMQLNKTHSFHRSTTKELQLFIELDIYMNLPAPTDILKYKLNMVAERQFLYRLIHERTQIQIVEMQNRSWVKIKFASELDVYEAQKQLSILTYRYYYNGFYLKLFTSRQITNNEELLVYERKVQKLYGIKTNIKDAATNRNAVSKKIDVDNPMSFFIWPNAEKSFMTMFKTEEVHKLPISVFIYNKNRRPLKVSCDFVWTTSLSIYHYRKKPRMQMRVRTPKQQKVVLESGAQHYLPHLRHKLNRQRQYSVKQHKSLIKANRQKGYSAHVQMRLLSETLNIMKRQ